MPPQKCLLGASRSLRPARKPFLIYNELVAFYAYRALYSVICEYNVYILYVLCVFCVLYVCMCFTWCACCTCVTCCTFCAPQDMLNTRHYYGINHIDVVNVYLF